MNPTRAAWFFVAGLAWLVLRSILVHAVPQLRADHVAEQGGLLLFIPLISVVASLAAPLFFLSFLRHHPFPRQRLLQITTVFAAIASLLSFALVLMAFVTTIGGVRITDSSSLLFVSWLLQTIPLLFVGSLFLFLVAFAQSDVGNQVLRRAAAVGAVGAMIPSMMIAAWVIHSRFPEHLTWYPAISQSLAAKVLGLAAAGTLLWFLETFATTYDPGADVADQN